MDVGSWINWFKSATFVWPGIRKLLFRYERIYSVIDASQNGAVLVHVSITNVILTTPLFLFCNKKVPLSSLLYRVVIIFIIIKIFFYVCWYRSRQRQLAAYLSNPRNAQIVIVGGRAYLHQMCERQSVSTDHRVRDKVRHHFTESEFHFHSWFF